MSAILLMLFCSYCFCLQTKRNYHLDSLTVLGVQNQLLLPILDSIIEHERKCDYYTLDLIFSIYMQDSVENKKIQIGAVGVFEMKSENEQGAFEYQGHLFIVKGQYLDESLFYKTGEKKFFCYYDPENDYDEETGELILSIIEDDSFSYWIYDYVKGQFTLKDLHTYCE